MKQDTYTLITGASTGFGKALALNCAERGHNLILVSLPCKELPFLADFINRNYAVKVICFEKDISSQNNCLELYKEIKAAGLAVNILINNAGLGGTNYFEDKELSFYQQQLEVNVMAPTFMSYLFLDDLKHNSPSFILNVSSLAGFFCMPKKQVYGGSKSYLVSFSRSLGYELKKHNISVSVVCPGAMNTTTQLTYQHMMASHLLKWSVMNPEAVACIAIDKMLQLQKIIIPGFWNGMMKRFDSVVPQQLKQFIIEAQLNKMENTLPKKTVPGQRQYPEAA
ncbi:MAG: SDR family NAD(P)-dependent oxidoreductase [Ferruginibacter sp.]